MLIQIKSDNTLRVRALLVYRGWFCKFSARRLWSSCPAVSTGIYYTHGKCFSRGCL